MAIAYHITFGNYGFWLPNDPWRSWSNYVFAERLRHFGPTTKTSETRSVAHVQHDQQKRLEAKEHLLHPPVLLDGLQAQAVAQGVQNAVRQSAYKIYACAIMPDHVHLVVGVHPVQKPGRMVQHFKFCATRQLRDEQRLDNHTPWARGYWCVYLDDEDEVYHAIEYVNQNPIKAGYKPQNWPFVIPAS